MSRLSAPEQIVVRPTNTVYTALVVICVVAELIGLIVLYMRHESLFPGKSFFNV
jgi:hypothetical protein